MNKEKVSSHDVLVVDDEQDIRKLMTEVLGDEGYKCREASNADDALQAINSKKPSLVILDIWLHGSRMDGMQILDVIMRDYADVPVLMISGHGNIETAVAAIKRGAYDFIEKPFKTDRLLLMVQRALEASRLRRENIELKRTGAGDQNQLMGKSNAINAVIQMVGRAAPTSSRVLLLGPQGSGKEVAARMLHAKSRRAEGPFVMVNCATLRADQFEQELFGAEATASSNRKIGLFEQANGGTLVLDEIADMPLETQGKIVRVLHDLTFVRVGGQTKVECDVRVVAITNKDPEEEMQAGRLRQDLYYRLNVVPIAIPGLAERRDDIPMLAKYFLQRASDIAGVAPRELGEDALAALQAYSWPGNVRQLRNAMEWVLIMSSGDSSELIRADQLPPEITNAAPHVLRWEKGGEIMSLPLRDAREMFEREYLLAQVTRFGGNISRTANFVGMERSALHRKLKLLGVHGGNGLATHEGSEHVN